MRHIYLSSILLFFALLLCPFGLIGQNYTDGCMTIDYKVVDSWVDEYEDPIFDDESVFRWYGADNANLDGQGWRGGSCLVLDGQFYIGWRGASHPVYNLFNHTYGNLNTNVQVDVPQFLALRGRYHGDDCVTGSICNYDNNGFTCLGNPDDYGYDDVLNNTINYRFGPPNTNNLAEFFTGNHGSSDFGARVRINYTSPRPTVATANPSTICGTGTGSTLAALGAISGGDYVWFDATGTNLIGVGQTVSVVPTTTTTYRVYTRNANVLSPCFNEVVVNVVNCSPNCVTKTFNDGSIYSIDCDELTLPFVNFTPGTDFPVGSLIEDVNVTVTWTKTDGTCAAPAGGIPFNNEVALELVGNASCLSTSLIEVGDYNVGSDIGTITTLFDMDAAANATGTPVSGNFLPQDNLDDCIGGSPFGSWSINAGDAVCADPLCISEYSVQLCVCVPATDVTSASSSPTTICGNNTGTISLSYAGGSGDEVHWFEGSCGSTAPLAISINGVAVSVPSPSATTTYFARWFSGATCGYSPGCESVTVTVDPESIPGTLSGGTSPICEGSAPAAITISGYTGNIVRWERSTDGGAIYSTLASTAGLTSYNSPSLMAGTYYFRAIVQNGVCNEIATAPLIIQVNPLSAFGTSGALDPVICSGDSTFVIVTGETGSIQWQISSDDVTYVDLPGAVTNTVNTGMLVNNSSADSVVYYQAVISNTPCASITTSPAIEVTIQPASDGGAISSNQAICVGQVPTDIIASDFFGTFVRWQRDTVATFTNPVDFNFGSSTILGTSLGALTQTTYFRAVVQNGVCPEVFGPVHTLVVWQEAINTITADQTICTGDVPSALMGNLPTLGNGLYTYQWESRPISSAVFTPISGANMQDYAPGSIMQTTVFRRIVDSGPCQSTSNEVTITTIDYPSITSVSNTTLSCYGDSSSVIDITTQSQVTFSIDSGMSYGVSNSFAGLPAGEYYVSVINATGCETFYQGNPLVIDEPDSIIALITATDPNCGTSNDGSISIAASGGTPGFEYALNGGAYQAGNTFTGLAPGAYTIFIRDANLCVTTEMTTLSAQYSLSLAWDTIINVGCPGSADGSVQLATTGGIAPFNFSLDNISFQADSLFEGLVAGNYTFFVEDANGCTASTSLVITEEPAIQVDVDSISNVTCNGFMDGAIYISASGSDGTFTYEWRKDGIVVSTLEDLTGLSAGTYNVTVSATPSCEVTVPVVVSEPTALSAITNNVLDASCNGQSSGSIDVSVTGGTTPYLFSWSDGASVVGTNEDLNNVAAGTYILTYTDANGCSGTLTEMIGQPSVMTVIALAGNPSCSSSMNGTITTNVTSGTAPFTYSLNNGPIQNSNVFSGLSAGLYSIQVEDANGCTAVGNAILTDSYSLTLSIDSQSNVSCAGQNDGSVSLSVLGGTAPITYTVNGTNPQINDPIFTGLSAGFYVFEATDANGCSAVVNTSISENAPLAITIDSTADVLCNGDLSGAVYISVSGGSGIYTYSWNDSNASANEDLIGVGAGSFSVVVTDNNGCTGQANATVTEPAALIGSISASQLSCFGDMDGSFNVTISGGTPPYNFDWDIVAGTVNTQNLNNLGAVTGTVICSDANGCSITLTDSITQPETMTVITVVTDPSCNNSNNGEILVNVTGGTAGYSYAIDGGAVQTANVFTGLSSGTYNIQVIDANGCIGNGNAILVDAYSMSLNVDLQSNVSCAGQNDGSVTLALLGGVNPITYTINGANAQINNGSFVGLNPGFYTFEAVDINGCSASTSTTITEEPPLSVTLDGVTNVLCNGSNTGGIDISVSGGSGTYTYLWNDANATATQDLSAVPAGTYTVVVTDASGCTGQISATVIAPQMLSLVIADAGNVNCAGAMDAYVDVSVAGGTPPYNYSWSDGAAIVGSNEDLLNVGAGSYTLSVTDNNSCVATINQVITEPVVMSGALTTTPVLCFGIMDGTASITVTGGTPPYQYLWSTFETSSSITSLDPGNISVQVTDANGCEVIVSDVVAGPAAMVNITLDDVMEPTCNGGNDGAINTTVTGGTGAITYTWTPNVGSSDDISNLPAGSYTLVATDANGCSANETFMIGEPNAFVTSMSITNPACFGSETGTAFVGVSGGTAPYSYEWNTNPVQLGALANNLAGDATYTVTVTDANGCTATADAALIYPSEIIITTNGSSVNCTSVANGSVSVSASGGNAPYTYQLNGAFQTDTFFDGLAAGVYNVFVTDNNNCTSNVSFEITQNPSLNIALEGAGNDGIYFMDELYIVRGETVDLAVDELNSTGATIVSYNWSPAGNTNENNVVDTSDCPLCPNTTINPEDNIWVIVEALDDNGCSIVDSLFIDVSQETIAFMPTAFSPNGDAWNDYFEMNILGATSFSVAIFNRWGEQIFLNENQTNGPDVPVMDALNPRNAWDGTYKGQPVPEGAYTYQVVVKYFDGKEETMGGTVTVIR